MSGFDALGGLPISGLPEGDDGSFLLGQVVIRPPRPREYLLIARPYDPDTGALTTVVLSGGGYLAPGDGGWSAESIADWTWFPGNLIDPGNVKLDFVASGRWTPSAQRTFGALTIANPDRSLDSITMLRWERRDLELWIGPRGWVRSYDEFSRFLVATAEGLDYDRRMIRVGVSDRRRALDVEINTDTFKGFGTALRLNGTTEWIGGEDVLDVDDAVSRTLSHRFRTGTAQVAALMGRKSTLAAAGDAGWMLYVDNDGSVKGALADGSAVAMVTSGVVDYDDSEWHRPALEIDRVADELRLYYDGALVDTADISSIGSATNAVGFYLGRRDGTTGSDVFAGDLDDGQGWDSALGAVAIAALDDGPVPASEQDGLLHYWRFEEGSGVVAGDDVSGGTNLTVTGGTWIGSGEGTASLRGLRRRRVWGIVRQVEGDLIDRQRQVIEVAYGGADSIAPFVDGNGDALTALGDQTDIYDVAPSAGEYTTQLDKGLVRIGGSAVTESRLTFDVEAGGTKNAAVIIQSIAEEAGVATANIDLGALGDIQISRPGDVGYTTVREPHTAARLLNLFSSTVDAYWYRSLRDGFLVVDLRALPVGFEETVTSSKIRSNPRRRRTAPPAKQLRVFYQRHYTTFEEIDIAGVVADDERAELLSEWRVVETPLDTDIETEHEDAEVLEVQTLYDKEEDALAERERRWAIDSRRMEVWEVDLVEGLFVNNVGQNLRLDLPVYDLDGGKLYRVAGLVETQRNELATLILWGEESQS